MSISDRLDQIAAKADVATAAVNEYLGDTIYACSRDYSAWGHGTMGLDDFTLASDDLDIAESLVVATANADVPALVSALRAVLAIDTGDNRSLYGIDFEAGMCKALAIVHQTIAAALGEGA